MKAAVIDNFKTIDAINIKDIELPPLQSDEVTVKIDHAGLNPVDWKIAEGLLKSRVDYQFPITLGWDLAGSVTAVGSEVSSLKVGDKVFGYVFKGSLHEGTFAEAMNAKASHLALIPPNLTFAEASVTALSALTAWQALFDIAKLKNEQTILVQAGAGSVGMFAVQFAKEKGATILTTVSEPNFDYAKSLGAEYVIDYKNTPFQKAVKEAYPEGLDVVFETVGPDSLKHDYEIVKKEGWLVSITTPIDIELLDQYGINGQWHFVQPNGEQLGEIADLIEEKRVIVPPVKTISMKEIPDALTAMREGKVKGKIAVKI